MAKIKKYKLYNKECGYKCLVTLQEINFFFGLDVETAEQAQHALIQNMTGYYIVIE